MTASEAIHNGPPRRDRRRRWWLFRLSAVLLGLLPIVAVELSLRGLDWPTQPLPLDPYLDLHNLRPLFQPETAADGSERMVIPAERLNLFNRAEFPSQKGSSTFRVFALGGSTTFGEPYSAPSAFPRWMEIYLQAAAPELQIEVINCGGLSYASYRVLAILKEVLQYQPDMILVYTGHNEYLERRSYGPTESWRPGRALLGWLSQLRIVQATRQVLGRDAAQPADQRVAVERTVMAAEVDALLDYRNGLQDYRRDDAWMEPVTEHFQWNLAAMRDTCQRAGVPLLLVRPVSNLVDCPPFKMDVDPELSSEELVEFEQAWAGARDAADASRAIALLEQALAIDPEHAGANFLLGRRLLEIGDTQRAESALVRARDCDVCPLRAPSGILKAIDRVAGNGGTGGDGVPLVDAERLFRQRSRWEIVGDQWLVDHIHPSVDGHRWLGETLAEEVIQQGWLNATPRADWRETAEGAVQLHLASLGEAYYQRGKQRLEGLLLWTQGRAKKLRPDDATPEP